MSDKVRIIYHHPNPKVRAKLPRVLDYTPTGGETQYFEPQEEEVEIGGNKLKCIVYDFNPMYARKLLASQPERYFLLSPESLFVKVPTKDRLATSTVKVVSVLKSGVFDRAYAEPKSEEAVKSEKVEAEREAAAQKPQGQVDPSTFTAPTSQPETQVGSEANNQPGNQVHTAQNAVEAHHAAQNQEQAPEGGEGFVPQGQAPEGSPGLERPEV